MRATCAGHDAQGFVQRLDGPGLGAGHLALAHRAADHQHPHHEEAGKGPLHARDHALDFLRQAVGEILGDEKEGLDGGLAGRGVAQDQVAVIEFLGQGFLDDLVIARVAGFAGEGGAPDLGGNISARSRATSAVPKEVRIASGAGVLGSPRRRLGSVSVRVFIRQLASFLEVAGCGNPALMKFL